VTRGQLPHRARSLNLNGSGAATAVPPHDTNSQTQTKIDVNGRSDLHDNITIKKLTSSCGILVLCWQLSVSFACIKSPSTVYTGIQATTWRSHKVQKYKSTHKKY